VIEEACTGCELCVEPCPVDCILMVPIPETLENWKWRHPEAPVLDPGPRPQDQVALAGG